jgi:hypothetical protein
MIEFATVPAKDGFEWVRISVRLVRTQWLRYVGLAALFLLILQFSAIISGGLLAVFLKPLLVVGFLAAAWHHERGHPPEIKHLFSGFKSNLKALLPLGLVFLIGVVIASAIASAVTGISLEALMSTDAAARPADPDMLRFMLLTLLFTLPMNAALWFAPALIVFSDATFFQALSISMRAWTRNVLAMIVYMFSIFGIIVLIAFVVAPVAYVGGKELQTLVAMILLVPLTAVLMVSDYVSYRRIFHRNERLSDLPVKN